jgi:replication factor C subunit 1
MKASSVVAAPKKADKDMPDLEEAIEEEDEGDVAEPASVDEEELNLKTDKYIKQPKAKAKKPAKKAAKAADEDEDDEDVGKASKAKAKAATRGKGKAKKA